MTSRRLVILGVLAAVPVACLSTAAGCRSTGPCGWIATQGDFWWPAAYVPLLLVVVLSLAWGARFLYLAARASHAMARLQRVAVPPRVVNAARTAGIDRMVFVAGEPALAFCAGFLRPTIYVSEGAEAGLSDSELMAVLHHEADHARTFEPIRRAARAAAADVLAFLPIVRWWTERQIARSELRADVAAERMAGRPALAGALLVMTDPALPWAAFAGHTELRARRLLGMKIDEPKAPRAMWTATVVYSWLALSLAGCLLEVLIALT